MESNEFNLNKDSEWFEVRHFDDGIIQDWGLYKVTYTAHNKEFRNEYIDGYDGVYLVACEKFTSYEEAEKKL